MKKHRNELHSSASVPTGSFDLFVVLCRQNWIPLGAIIYSGSTHTHYLSIARNPFNFLFPPRHRHRGHDKFFKGIQSCLPKEPLQILHWWFKALIGTSLTDLLAYNLLIATFVLRICYIWLNNRKQHRLFFFIYR